MLSFFNWHCHGIIVFFIQFYIPSYLTVDKIVKEEDVAHLSTHLFCDVHSLYGCSPHSLALNAARMISPPLPTSPSLHPMVAPSPPSVANPPRLSLNLPSAPLPISQRYRPYSVTSPLGISTSPRLASLPGLSRGPITEGLPVPPIILAQAPAPPLPTSPQSVPLPSTSPHPPTSMPLPLVPPSPRSAARGAALATRIPSRYILNHV